MSEVSTPMATVDESYWPLVLVTYPARTTERDWSQVFDRFAEVYRRREPFHVVSDAMRVVTVPSAAERRVIAERTRETEAVAAEFALGSAMAVPNAIVRGALTAIAWISSPAFKMTYHPTLLDAVDEAFATFERRGIAIPPRASTYRAELGALRA